MTETCLIVAPHPDDETIGAAIWMDRHRDLDIHIVHVTDGSPRDLRDARAAGLHSRRAYAHTRRRELYQAVAIAGIDRRRLHRFPFVDKETCFHLPELIDAMVALLDQLRPALVLSPAYEGGHPDHDSSALAVHAARRRLDRLFRHREYPLYHAGPNGEMISGEFLPNGTTDEDLIELSRTEREKKLLMLATFATQQDILNRFSLDHERFRDAPAYDFKCPPHPGKLLYEYWGLGVTGEEWRSRAAAFCR